MMTYIIAGCLYTRIKNIHMVHESQYALRHCGLGELADNFIIKNNGRNNYEREH